ncbi:Prefoldin subunit 6 [Camelus dromedarius]|uniref:Prefoldin subunit 6 n=1 Tax=Camelus dromedarius TaxID=9838 RepID=A0A5N4D295_CAMDR|nr:Prefoldin subunit 6 [Camelus dromedarius]
MDFKLLGPVLVKQEQGEARAAVGKSLDYIRAEIKRYESRLRDLELQSEQRETLCSAASGAQHRYDDDDDDDDDVMY